MASLAGGVDVTTLFLHGAGSNADFWHKQREAFPDGVYLDLPGHGLGLGSAERVSLRGEKYGIDAYADAVEAYIEDRKLYNVVLNGHSMGGAIAQTLALRLPSRLRGLILTGTGARLQVSPLLIGLLETDYSEAVELIVEWSFARVEGEMSYEARIARNGTRRRLLRTSSEVTLADYASCDGFDVTARLREIKVPTLVIVGADDRMTRPRLSTELHEGIAGSRLSVVEGAGHMLPAERADEYNRVVGEFIEQCKLK